MSSLWIPLLAGLLSLWLFSDLLLRFGLPYPLMLLSTLLLLSSPPFLFLFSFPNFTFLALTLSLLVADLLLRRHLWAAGLLFFGLPFLNRPAALFAFAALFLYIIREDQPRLALLFLSLPLLYFSPAPSLPATGSFLADLGGSYGLGIFTLLLAGIGLAEIWKEKYAHLTLYAFLLLTVLASLATLRMLAYLNLFLAPLAGLGMVSLLRRPWKITLIKHFTPAIFVVGLLLSGLSYALILSQALPNKDVLDGLRFVHDQTPLEARIFTEASRAPWMEFFSRTPVVDPSLFPVRELAPVLEQMTQHGITHIWVDRGMMDTLWDEEDEGLLFPLRYSKEFRLVFTNGDVTIWAVEPQAPPS